MEADIFAIREEAERKIHTFCDWNEDFSGKVCQLLGFVGSFNKFSTSLWNKKFETGVEVVEWHTNNNQ